MSQPPEYPGEGDPQGGKHEAPGYEAPGYQAPGYQAPGYGTPPPPPPGYSPPPPPPGYGPPPQPPGPAPGGPPQGGYSPPGYTPPPPPPPGYGASPSGYPAPSGYEPPASQFNVGDALSWSWNKFTQNAAALIVPVLAYALVLGAVIGLVIGLVTLFSDTTTTSSTDTYGHTYKSVQTTLGPGAIIILVLGCLAVFAVAMYMHAGLTTGCLDLADGKPVTIGTFFRPRNFGMAIVTGLLFQIGTLIGTALCIVPGIIFAFLAQFAITAAVDRSLSPIESIKNSIATMRSDIGGSLLSYLVQVAALLVGQLCLIGMLVGIPVAALIQVYTYRKLSGGQVVDANQPAPQAGIPPQGPPAGPQFA